MYKIYMQNLSDASPTLIYQSDNKSENLIIEPKLSFEWQQHGSLDFSMLPGHPAYTDIHSMITFVTVYWDDEELFYGRVVTIDKTLHGQKDVYCEGALSFLSDGEVQAYDGSTTAQAFFSKCLTDYNATVESRKQFSLGTCEFTDSGIYFKMEENSEARSVLDEQLVKRLGGCMVVRKTSSGHSLNYLKQVGSSSSQKIRICENVQDRTEHDSGESLFTILRPIGANDIDTHETVKLSGSGVIEIPAMIAKYGRITKTENFSDQTTEAGLRAEAEKYIERLGMSTDKLPVTVDFSFVDFHYLNPSITRIHFGDVFEDIEGYEGEALVVGALELDLEDPKNDTLSLYNKTYLDAREYSALLESATGSASRGGGGGGSSLAKALSSLEETEEEKFWKHVHATDDALMLFGDRIQLAADILIGSTREYDVLASDVEELYGTHLHGNGNGFWEMYGRIVRDEDGNITIADGAGLRVERTEGGITTSYGVYDEQTLTAGIMVDKLNDDNTTYILGDRIIIGNVATTYQVALVTGSDASNYTAINPHQLRYYELINGQYVYSEDTVAQPNKTYYSKKISLPADGSGLTANARLEREANRIGLVVEGYGADATIRSAEIVAAINDDGTSGVLLRADRINIDSTSGSSFTIDENGKMTFNAENAIVAINAATAEINAGKIALNSAGTITLASKMAIEADTGYLSISGSARVADTLFVTNQNGGIRTTNLNIGGSTGTQGEETGTLSYRGESFNIQRAFLGNGLPPGGYITLGRVLTTSASELDFNHSHAVSMEEITSGANVGKVHAVIGAPVAYDSQNTANRESFFDIAASQTYIDGVAAAYANAVNRVAWPTTPASPPGSFSMSVPGNPWNASTETGTTNTRNFSLSAGSFDANYISTVNLTMSHNESGWTVTDGVVARINVDASGVYSDGWTAGDANGYTRAANQRTTLYTSSNGTFYAPFGYSMVEVDVSSSTHNITIMASSRESSNPGGYVEIFQDAGAYADLRNKVDGFYTFKVSCGGTDKWYGFWVGPRG